MLYNVNNYIYCGKKYGNMQSPIQEIKNRLDIVQIIGEYLKLKKTGVNFRALCPFHSEKTPSFFVSPSRQIWHCFGGCSEGGDIFKFVMKIEGVEFADALRILAQKAGVKLKPIRPELRTEKQRLYEICEMATKFFERQLKESSIGKEVKKYLLARGLADDSIREWRLGYAPDTWQGLSDFLVSKGYKKEEIIKAGLAIKKEDDKRYNFYDRFRGRIIFPIFDLNSQVIGFGARIFKEENEQAKYVNIPNTLLYNKSQVLYGLDRAKLEIRRKDFCILVEGYLDVIMSSQAGIKNVAAVSGTALTNSQLLILKRYSQNLTTAFDMDIAGDLATKKGIDLAQLMDFNLKIVIMPEGKDPADIIKEDSKIWEKVITNSKSILDFYFETTLSKINPEASGNKKEIAKILIPPIKRIQNKIEQSFWIKELAKKLKVSEESIIEEIKKTKFESSGLTSYFDKTKEIKIGKIPRKKMLEEKLISLILKFPKNIELIDKNYLSLFSPSLQEILLKLQKIQDFDLKKNNQLKGLTDQTLDLFNYLSLKAEVETGFEEEISICLEELVNLKTKGKLLELSESIKEAEKNGDTKSTERLIGEFDKIAKRLVKPR